MKYITKHFKNLLTNKTTIFKGIQDKKIVAITAIGNPESFFSTLEGYDLEFKKVTYNDHYLFNKNDFIKYEDYNIVMTEKDAIKCQKFPIAVIATIFLSWMPLNIVVLFVNKFLKCLVMYFI